MHKTLISGAALLALMGAAARAEAPAVVADIPPVHSLVARVMGEVGEPAFLIQPGASPHSYALRPSEARALEGAAVVFWVGDDLTPWLRGAVDALAADAEVVALMSVPGTTTRAFREGATFDAHDHGEDHEEGHDHDEGHDHAAAHDEGRDHDAAHGEGHDHDAAHDGGHDHDAAHDEGHDHDAAHDEGHDHDAAHDEGHDHGAEHDAGHDHDAAHGEGHDHDAAHDHGEGRDPHAWLDPENARVWLAAIAEALAAADPENAALYRANAEAARAEIADLIDEVSAQVAPVRDRPFVVFHDAYQYFERRFDLQAAGAISLGDSSAPSPARIAEIQARVAELDAGCVFSEPQFNPGTVRVVLQGSGARTAVMDPLGVDLEPGAEHYPALIRSLAGTLVGCLE